MTSSRHPDLSDYEVMFKKHVHDNLILNSDLRLIDEMKKSKLRELKRDKDAFKSRFSRYSNCKGIRSLPDMYYTANTTPRATPKPSFVVCKTSPCSLKTWNNMTDITKEGVDVYRTDVLRTKEAGLSFRKNTSTSGEVEGLLDRKLSSASLVERNRGSLMTFGRHSSTAKSPRTVVNVVKTEDSVDDWHLPDFRQRSSTMPSYDCRTKGTSNVKTVIVSKSCEKIDKRNANETVLEDGPPDEESQDEKKTRCSNLQTNHTDHSDDAVRSSTDQLKETPDLKEEDQRDSNQTASPKCVTFRLERTKSLLIPRDQDEPRMFRRRSYTVGSTKTAQKEDSKLLAKRESVSLNKLDKAVRRLSLFDKLVASQINSNQSDSDAEFSNSMEELQACRYLRVPGQSIMGSAEDLSLENIHFRQEN